MRTMLLAVAVCAAFVARADDAKTKEAKAQPGVNWAGQVVRATGAGAPDLNTRTPAQARLGAERAARADALRNLIAQVKGISVDGSRKVGDLMEKDEIRTRVEGLVRGYKIVDKRYFSDGGLEVEIEVPLALLTDVLDPDATQVLANAAATAKSAEPKVTGVVIDARGLKLTPSLLPRLIGDDGKPVYSIDSLSADARKQSAVAAWVGSLDDAHKSLKAGEKPLVVKLASATGADLQLDAEGAKKLAAVNRDVLADGRVVIVLN